MGIRIHRAMGYGMPWHQFQQQSTLGANDTHNKLWEIFDAAKSPQLTVPEEIRKKSFSLDGSPIFEPYILAKSFTDFGRRPDVELGVASDLFFTTGYDDIEHIGFLPDLTYRDKWYRYNDDLDYFSEQYREDSEGQADMREFVTYTRFGPYPFSNDLMAADGSRVPWDHHVNLRKRTDWAPAVPASIRWYLKTLGVMDDEGVNQLRPLIAQWWA